MNSEEITTGGVRATDAHRIMCAKSSLKFCIEKDNLAMEIFREELQILLEQRIQGSGWPPERPKEEEVEKPQVEEKTRRRRIRDKLKDKEKQEKANEIKKRSNNRMKVMERMLQGIKRSVKKRSEKNLQTIFSSLWKTKYLRFYKG